jgi:hypothetical protein
VGVDFDVEPIVFPSVSLPPKWIDQLAGTGITVEFAFYPGRESPPSDQ